MSESIKRPYVGVSGVTTPEMQLTLEALADNIGLTESRLLVLGVKAVHKTQFLDIENKYGKEWYPVGEEAFSGALRHDDQNPDTLTVAQAYFDVSFVNDPDYREKFLKRITERGQHWLQAMQFDMLPWHNNTDMWGFLGEVKEKGLGVLLQAHKNVMETLGPVDTVRLLGRHASLIDYVLFDSSHGTGTRLDTAAIEPFLAESYDKLDTSQTGVAIAGGLNGQVVREDLPQLVDVYPDLSWDAEGQLHPADETGKHPLNISVARDYLEASTEVLH